MRKILMIKHWQLAALIVLPPILFSATSIGQIVSIICGLLLLLWIYSIGYYGQERMRSLGLKPMKLILFQVNVLLLPVLLLLSKLMPFPPAILEMVLGIYSGIAAIHVLLFAGKTVARLEYRKEVSLSEYFINSLQIAAFILGIWTLQPKLNSQFGNAK